MAGPHPLFERRDVAGENLNVIFSAGKTQDGFCSCTLSNFGKTSLEHFRILWAKINLSDHNSTCPFGKCTKPLAVVEGCFVAYRIRDQPALESFHVLTLLAHLSPVGSFWIAQNAIERRGCSAAPHVRALARIPMKTFPGGGILRGRGPGNLVAESSRADPPCCHHTRAWRLQATVFDPLSLLPCGRLCGRRPRDRTRMREIPHG